MTDYLYIMDRGDARKIGFSNDPSQRLKDIRREHKDVQLLRMFETDNPRDCERAAHNYLAEKRLDGEWFDVNTSEATEAIEWALNNPCPPSPIRFNHKKRQKQMRLTNRVRERFEKAQEESGMTADAFIEYLLDQADGEAITNTQLIAVLRERLP